MAGSIRSAVLLAAAFGVAACGIERQEAPALIGPSGFGQSVSLSAIPDRLPRDGSSQSVVTIAVRNDSGQPTSGQRVTLGASAGTLSQAEVVTGGDGRATVTITAPPPGSTGNTIEVFATPVGGNFDNAITRSLSIAVTGMPNSTAPTVEFTLAPQNPGARETVTFDASTTRDEGAVCGAACTYTWNFGDGTIRSGAVVTHRFDNPGTYTVTLTVSDAGGAVSTRQQIVTVATIPAPTVAIAVAPAPPLAGQSATFTANVVAAPGRTITSYAWNFGDGTTQTTSAPSVTKTYTAQGVYVVTVTVTQDTGQTASASQQVTLSSSAVNASILFSPREPQMDQLVHFTALNPTAPNGATIPESGFVWNFGDSEQSGGGSGQGRTAEHRYRRPGNYVVRLTITDSNGIVGVVTTIVPVAQLEN